FSTIFAPPSPFNAPSPPVIYTLSLHDALPIYAVCHASAAGAWAGSPANHQLLLWRKGYRQGPGCVPAAFEGQPGIFHSALGNGHALSGRICSDVYFGCTADGIHKDSASNIYGGNAAVWYSDGMPDDL